jgi:hypothetical protein
MFSATVTQKVYEGNAIKIYVDFSDGEKTVNEWVIPQNEEGFNHWINSRLEVFNSSKEIDAKLDVGDKAEIIKAAEDVVVEDIAVTARVQWFNDVNHLDRVMKFVVDRGLLADDATEVVALRQKIVATYKPEYFEYI